MQSLITIDASGCHLEATITVMENLQRRVVNQYRRLISSQNVYRYRVLHSNIRCCCDIADVSIHQQLLTFSCQWRWNDVQKQLMLVLVLWYQTTTDIVCDQGRSTVHPWERRGLTHGASQHNIVVIVKLVQSTTPLTHTHIVQMSLKAAVPERRTPLSTCKSFLWHVLEDSQRGVDNARCNC